MITNPILEANDVDAGYGKITIVNRVSWNVNENEIVSIIGPNGSGKSTLLKALVGLAKITHGSISFHGRDLSRTRPHKVIKLGIGYVPQVKNIFEDLAVEENLEIGGYIRSDKSAVKSDIQEMFTLFPILESRRRQNARTLSGGERQLLAIAKGLMTRPRLLLLDEPTASLSPIMTDQIFKKIREINDRGVTIVLVEQNVKQSLRISNRGIVLVGGRKVLEGSAEDLSKHDLGAVFLGKELREHREMAHSNAG